MSDGRKQQQHLKAKFLKLRLFIDLGPESPRATRATRAIKAITATAMPMTFAFPIKLKIQIFFIGIEHYI